MFSVCRQLSRPGRGSMRIVAVLANTAMALYIYAAHLLGLEWERFGRLGPGGLRSTRLLDYFLGFWELDTAFDHLRILSFSDAMLEKLDLFVLVGAPVAVVYLALEHSRIRWLQGLVAQRMIGNSAVRASRWLEAYLWSWTLTVAFVLSIAPFHLEWPRAHYCCASFGFFFGCLSVALYLAAPVDFAALAAGASSDSVIAARWASRVQYWVRPALAFVLWLHFAALVAGLWKISSLADDRAALVFGVLETAVVVGYQLFQAVFVVDDAVFGRTPPEAKKQLLPAEHHKGAAAPQCSSGSDADASNKPNMAEALDDSLNERLLGS